MNPGKLLMPPKWMIAIYFALPPDIKSIISHQIELVSLAGAAGGLQGAVEMCNNNGSCRKLTGGVMCPSFRVTRNEIDSTRGRANSLRLACLVN